MYVEGNVLASLLDDMRHARDTIDDIQKLLKLAQFRHTFGLRVGLMFQFGGAPIL